MPVLALNLHAGFTCRHSGACCTAGWPIPVERDVVEAILAKVPAAGAAFSRAGEPPDGAAAVIVPTPEGACPFFVPEAGRLCDIQRRLGHAALPASCRCFPRVALVEADATRVTLSHFCPTAAWMLFADGPEGIEIVADAAGIADSRSQAGFDARATIPPLLRPGVAMDGPTCRIWEACLLNSLAGPEAQEAEGALARVAAAAEAVRGWPAGTDTLEAWARSALAPMPPAPHRERWSMSFSQASRLFSLAVDTIPEGLPKPALPDAGGSADAALVLPRWVHGSRPLKRYLAARSFGAWSAYLGEGLRTQVAMLAVALAAVRVEAAREAARAGRAVDDEIVHAAIRSADLLLHHLADAAELVREVGRVEEGSFASCLAFMGLEAAR
jgi:hypothetical protein